jgi:hypothetical protein
MAADRQAPRRVLPYVRSAVLETEERAHIVTLTDISLSGAFLATRVALEPDQSLRLRVILPGASRESLIPCRFVRWGAAQTGPEDSPRRFGLGVRFEQMEDSDRRLLEEFAARAREGEATPEPAADAPPSGLEPFGGTRSDRFEYQVLERASVDAAELNRLGEDGWVLAAALPHVEGVQLVFLRQR